MREFTKSFISYSLAMSFFGLKQFENLFRLPDRGDPKGPAALAFEAVTSAATEQFDGPLRSMFRAADGFQRGIVELTFALLFPFGGGETRRDRRTESESAPADGQGSASGVAEPQRWTEVMDRVATQ